MEQLGDVTGDDAAPPDTPTPAQPSPQPDRVIGGVAGTIANRLGVDALWVRLAFVVLGLAGGIGVVVYGALWLVFAGESGSRAMRIAGGALLVAGVPVLIADDGQAFITGPVAVILLLAGLALALWQPRREQPRPAATAPVFPPPVPRPPPPTAPESGDTDGSWQVLADAMRPPATERPAPRFTWRRTPREQSVLGRITLFVAVYVGAAWALADQLDGGRLHPEQWFGAAAIICGAGMVIGMFIGHARWLIVPAVLAAGVGYVGGTMARMGITSGDLAGDRYVSVGSYTAASEIDERVGMGELQITIDSAPPAPVHIDARVALGRIQLQVPSDVTVELRPRLDQGSITSNRGLALSEGSPTLIGDGTTPDVVLDAWVGVGHIDVNVFEMLPARYPDAIPPTVPPVGALVPTEAGALVPIRDGVAMTTDGWVVLGNGEAVISPEDAVAVDSGSDVYAEGPDGTSTINTAWGPFRLLPRSLLITPDGAVLDLQALRAQVASTATTTSPAADPGGITTTTLALTSAPTEPPTITTITVPATSVPVTTIPGG